MLILSSVLLAYGNPSNMNMGGYKTANYNANLEHNLLDMDIADIMNMLKSGAKREAKRDQQQMFKKKSGPKRDQRHILHQTIGVLPSGPKTYLPQGVIPPPPYDPTLPPPYDPTTGYPLNPYETSPHIIPPDFHSIYNQPPEKLYNHPNSNQNCSVEDEIIISQICTPTQQTMCEENSVTYKKIVLKDYCYDFAQTECTESEEIIPNDVCVFDYQPKESMARATNLEVKFEKSCDKQMVTVCDPNYYHHGYEPFHSGYGTAFEAHCKEIRQEICFNAPTVSFLHITYMYIELLKIGSFHDLPLRNPLADQAALRDKSWMETIFKIMAGMINVSICNVVF